MEDNSHLKAESWEILSSTATELSKDMGRVTASPSGKSKFCFSPDLILNIFLLSFSALFQVIYFLQLLMDLLVMRILSYSSMLKVSADRPRQILQVSGKCLLSFTIQGRGISFKANKRTRFH